MSVEIRIVTEGPCGHGTPKLTPSRCRHFAECDWGRIEYANPDPTRGEVRAIPLGQLV